MSNWESRAKALANEWARMCELMAQSDAVDAYHEHCVHNHPPTIALVASVVAAARWAVETRCEDELVEGEPIFEVQKALAALDAHFGSQSE